LDRAACDAEEVLSVWLGKTAIAFGNGGYDLEGGAVHRVCKMVAMGRELLRQIADRIIKSTDFW
jgi:hypothetical protein